MWQRPLHFHCFVLGELPAEYTADSDDEDYLDDETGSGTVEKRPITPASLNNDNTSQTKGVCLFCTYSLYSIPLSEVSLHIVKSLQHSI